MKALLPGLLGLLLAVTALAANDVTESLVYAVRTGDAAGAERLIRAGADVNAKDQVGMTPLINAVESDRPEMVEFLLNHGADPQAVSEDNQLPTINYAATRRRLLHSSSSRQSTPTFGMTIRPILCRR